MRMRIIPLRTTNETSCNSINDGRGTGARTARLSEALRATIDRTHVEDIVPLPKLLSSRLDE